MAFAKGQFIAFFQLTAFKAARACLQVGAVAVEPGWYTKTAMHTQVTTRAPLQFGKMQHGVFAHGHRVPAWYLFIVEHGAKIGAGNADEGILLKEYLRGGEMEFQCGPGCFVTYQQVGGQGGIPVHGAAGIDAEVAVAITAHILQGV